MGDHDSTAYKNTQVAKGKVSDAVAGDVQDLSTIHGSLGALYGPLPTNWTGYSAFLLPQERVEEFWANGFISDVPILTLEQCDILLEEYEFFLNPDKKHAGHGLFHEFHRNQTGDANNVLLHALGHWRITPAFHDLVFHPAVVAPASQLLKEGHATTSVRFWHDQLFAKPPHHGGNVAWHQDYSYWTRTQPMAHLTVHIALDDQTVENGCLMYVPGSHRWHRDGKPLPITADDFADMSSIQQILTETERTQWVEVPTTLKRGHATFHHPLAVHGSYGNRSAGPRRAAVLNYFADGTMAFSTTELLAGVGPFPRGHPLDGQFFPLVYDAASD